MFDVSWRRKLGPVLLSGMPGEHALTPTAVLVDMFVVHFATLAATFGRTDEEPYWFRDQGWVHDQAKVGCSFLLVAVIPPCPM